jgi:hypothetical protein
MTGWDVLTWAAILVLGPGAVVVFVAFLRDARRLLGQARSADGDDAGR